MIVQHDGGGGREWPGLSVPSGQLRMDPDALIAAAAQLETELESVTGRSAGSLPQLSGATVQPAGTSFFGGWDVAREMADGYRVAQETFTEAYQRLVEELGKATLLLRENAGDTEAVDRQVASGMHTQEGRLDASGRPVWEA